MPNILAKSTKKYNNNILTKSTRKYINYVLNKVQTALSVYLPTVQQVCLCTSKSARKYSGPHKVKWKRSASTKFLGEDLHYIK